MKNDNEEELDQNESIKITRKDDRWYFETWRPFLAWSYLTICLFDFLVAPILWAILQAYLGHTVVEWDPITLHGAGLYHLAMGSIVGVTSWSRGQEKLAQMNNYGRMTDMVYSRNNPIRRFEAPGVVIERGLLEDTDGLDGDAVNRGKYTDPSKRM